MSTALVSRDNPLHSLSFFSPSYYFTIHLSSLTLNHNLRKSPPVRQPRWHSTKHQLLYPVSQLRLHLQGAARNTCKHRHMEYNKQTIKYQLYFAEHRGPGEGFVTSRVVPLTGSSTPRFLSPPFCPSTFNDKSNNRALLPSSIRDPGFAYIRLLRSHKPEKGPLHTTAAGCQISGLNEDRLDQIGTEVRYTVLLNL